MKQCCYITIIAVVATICLQACYISNLYNQYIAENIITIDENLVITIGNERLIRSDLRYERKFQAKQVLRVKSLSDMTQQELDSIRKLPESADTIDLLAGQKAGIGKTAGEMYDQLSQDNLLKAGFPLNLQSLDSLWMEKDSLSCPHRFLLYGKDSIAIDSIGNLGRRTPNYISKLFPIGTKGLQYLQIKADIPMSPFLRNQIWTLALSACMMLLVLLCLFYQLTVIRRKEALLRQRELTINGTIHDLKSPLNSVVTMLSWLKMIAPDKETKEAIETSEAGVKHLVCDIESLLVTARKDRQRIMLNKTLVDIPQMADRVKKEIDRLYQGKPHAIHIYNNLPAHVQVEADGMYIENVLRNLVENSVKYADSGVVVEVILGTADGKLCIAVKDNGWGIAPQYHKKLFAQFYQVPRGEDRRQKGYGIGLAQAKYIIDEHGGDIKVESAEGKGSTFAFTIPLAK